MGRSFVVIEGRGEEQAMVNLLTRLSADLGRRWPRASALRFLHAADAGAVYPPAP